MKKRLLTKVFGIFLAAAVAVTSIPVTTNAQTVSENEVTTDTNEISDIFTFDWKNATDEELDHILGITDFDATGTWLKSLSEDEFNQVISRDTVLNKEMSVATYDVDEDGEMVESNAIDSVIYYEYCLSRATGLLKAQTFQHKSGYYDYKFVMGSKVSQFRMKISDLDTSVDTSKQQKATIAVVAVQQTNGNFAGFASKAGNYNVSDGYTEKKLSNDLDGTGNYYNLIAGFGFTKPAGYSVTLTKENAHNGNCSIYYYENGAFKTNKNKFTSDANVDSAVWESLVAYTNLYTNTTVGGSSQSAPANPVCYTFTFTPSTYVINYNGNGANGGSTASQTCTYGNTYYTPTNGYTRAYTVTYNGNGGTPAEASKTAYYTFAGWGWENPYAANFSANQGFVNARTSGTGTFYAIWSPASIKLPTATRNGYTFGGWYSGNTKIGGSGSAFTPSSNVTLTAGWAANSYNVKFDSNGGSACNNISARYDQTINLPTPTKAGYNFVGWSGAGGTYKGTAKNLSSTNGATVTLTALWEASTSVPYKVIHMVEKEDGKYEIMETENLTGTTGATVTPATKSYGGHKSPDQQTKSIAGDGSTVFEYKYELIISKSVIYKVEHYLQNKTDKTKYDLDKTNSKTYYTTEGSSVTPPVITTYTGYDVPNPQTVTVAADGSTIVKYYYKLSSTGTTNNNTNNENNTTNNGDVNGFNPGETKYYTDAQGNTYEIFVNQDGTLTIRSIKTAAAATESVKIAGTITINGVKYQVTEIAPYAFKNNKKIKKVTIGKGITKIGKGAFEGCTNLKTVRFGVGLSVIGARAFYGCTSLEKVYTTKTLTEIGSKAFYNCKKLKSYTIGKYVKKIGSYAFYNCQKLKKITISESVEIIEKKAFYKCKSLKSVPIKTTKLIKVGSGAFKKCNKKLTFTVPEKKRKAYAKLLKGKS